ncbi:ABC transporter permease [Desulfonema ishimotonii]|uniref:ABC transporter permease n=1 Tax=Desulfonema ishimotonii TaxID=45657 RepID=UPI00140A9CEE|nr:ABC transporter permease subunit [Desulfonema ishimotonii]
MKIFFKPVRSSLIAFFLFLALWSLLSAFFEPYIVPSPPAVIKNISVLCDAVFRENFRISLGRILAGFCVSFGLGTGIGVLSYTLRISATVETVLVLFQVMPGLILGVIFLLIFGVGSAAPVCLIVTLSTPLIAINTANTLMKKNPFLEGVIRSFNGTFRHILLDLYLPALIPTMKTNTTMGLVMALKIVLLGEFIASENGIGYLLNVSKIYFNMEAVFFYLFVILLLIVGFQIVVNSLFVIFFEKYLYPD